MADVFFQVCLSKNKYPLIVYIPMKYMNKDMLFPNNNNNMFWLKNALYIFLIVSQKDCHEW